MAFEGLHKMSLLAQYDDLCRCTNVLVSGVEEEFKIFVENQLNYVRKWKKAEEKVNELQSKIRHLDSENERFEAKINHLKNALVDADLTRKKVEWEKKCLERTIAAVREIILSDGEMDNQMKESLSFLNCSFKPPHLGTIEESVGPSFSVSDDDDQTYDDLERKSPYRRSCRSRGKSSQTVVSLKKKKLSETEEFLRNLSGEAQQIDNGTISTVPDVSQVHKLDSTRSTLDAYNRKSDMDSIAGSSPVSREDIFKHIGKNHQFVSKTVLRSVKCLACKHNIGHLKVSLKCQVCDITCHPECKNMCPAYCFPIINKPTKGTNRTVADYTSSFSPMIPPLIVYCVKEIESRGMKDIGLYRIPASESGVRNLIDQFTSGRTIPCLNDVDVHTLCVAVKEFLRSLSEPLIAKKSWQAFVDAANMKDAAESAYALRGLVSELPQPNRDTLSFLMLHWQKIAESRHCKMDIENLCKVLGPIVVGLSTSEPAGANIFEKTTIQFEVMKRLFSISTASWQSMISVQMFQVTGGTPENIPTPKGRLLGPVHSSVKKRTSVTLRKVPLTPRNSKSDKLSRTYLYPPLLN